MRNPRSAAVLVTVAAAVSMSAVAGAGLARAAGGSADRRADGVQDQRAQGQRVTASRALLPAGRSWTVTLVTGDVVRVRTIRGRPPLVTVAPGPGRLGVAFSQFVNSHDVIEVWPEDVMPLIGRVLDPALFNVTTLIANRDDNAHRSYLPLIVQGRGAGTAALPALVPGTVLASIGAVAAREPRSAASRVGGQLAAMASAVARAGRVSPQLTEGIGYIWLDTTVRASAVMPGLARASVTSPGRAQRAAGPGAVLDHNLVQIGAPVAWRAGDTGAGIKVAVLDSGVDATFPDLRGQIVAQRNFTSPNRGDVTDKVGQGTFVASLIAGTGRAAGGERRGVAFGARLVIGKVIDDNGFGLESWVIAGMEWAAARARIINMSLAGPLSDGRDPLSQALNRLTASRHVLFVAAAGDSGPSDLTIQTPGAADAALDVGAVDGRDRLAFFSSRGPREGDFAIKPEITAPGVNVVGARAAGTALGTPIDARYTVASGTSFAAPEVAGAAAILAALHPSWSPARLKADLVSTAHPATGGDFYQLGGGRLDIAAAVSDQVTATRAIADLGAAADGSVKVVRAALAWASTARRATGLRLSVTLTDHNGHPAPGQSFALTATRIRVPAGGMASVGLVIRARLLAGLPALYEGQIVARHGKTTIRTPISFYLRPPTHTLTIRATPLPGTKPANFFSFAGVFDLNDPDIFETAVPVAFPGCNANGCKFARLQVPAGRYLVMGTVIDGSDAGLRPVRQAIVGQPEVNITRNTSVLFNAATAVRVRATVTGRPTILQDEGIHVERAFAGQVSALDVFYYPELTTKPFLYENLTGPAPRIGSFHAYSWFRLSNPAHSTSNYVYDLYHSIGLNNPGSADYKITPAEQARLAKLTVHFYAVDGNTVPVADTRYGLTRTGFLAVQNVGGGPGVAGSTRTDYVSAGPEIGWDQEAFPSISHKGVNFTWVTEVPGFTSYTPGSRHVLDWAREPFAPGPYSATQPDLSFCAPLPPTRVRAYIHVELVDLQDLPDGFDCEGAGLDPFWTAHTSRVMRLYLGSRLIGTSQQSVGTFTVPPQAATYKLTYTTRIGQVLPVSTRTATTWTFRSAAPGVASQVLTLPLLLVRYHLPLNLDNHPDGRTATLTVTRIAGTPRAKVIGLRLWTSTNGGTTWQQAPVRALGDGKFAVTLPQASSGQAVSLRVQATDAGGSKIDQTIITAYHG